MDKTRTSERELHTEGRTITESDIVFFSYFTGDWTFLHTDVVEAKNSFFGERIAHGYLTLSVSLGLLVRAGMIDKERFLALKSIESVRFLKPVKINDTVRVFFTISDSEDGSRINVTTKARTVNQTGEDVLEFTTIHVLRR
ncbi:MAG: dehydratase [Candidatus Thermoplasmatota archaeon]|nr:dehydratase [Candidatus Thermoplasmatota archaeon]